MNIREELFKMQDPEYKEFHSKLIPTVNPDLIIGVRTPVLRSFAKRIKNSADDFLRALPHVYYEENALHSFLISEIGEYDKCIELLNQFLPFVDNWAICDGLRPKCFKKNKEKLLSEIKEWLKSDCVYTVRFAIGMLMVHYLDDDFDESFLKTVSEIESEEYYINMMIAWYFTTALAKQWESAVAYLEEKRLSVWVHNKSIQKAIESYRITVGQKEYLRKLKRK